MKTTNKVFATLVCGALSAVLSGFGSEAHAQQAKSSEMATSVPQARPSQQPANAAELPDSPGAMLSQATQDNPPRDVFSSSSAPVSPNSTAILQAQASPPTSGAAQQPQSPPQKPVGTAAAGAIPSSGIAASQPAGIAIAPAKQHRVRSIVLRSGAILGAGVAIGSVVALSEATSSKPPGAR